MYFIKKNKIIIKVSNLLPHLNAKCLNVVGTVGASREIGQIELNLIPAVVESHGHGADKGLDARGALVVACAKSAPNVLVVEHLHLECEVFLKVLDDHDEEGQLDAKRLFRVGRTRDVRGAHVGAHYFEHERLNVVISYTLDVAVSHLQKVLIE